MSTNKQALRDAAEKATPGKWWIDSHGSAMVSFSDDKEVLPVFITDGDSMGPAVRHEDTGNLSHWRNDNDATFIAAANPATVLALLDELEAAEKRIAELTTADGNLIAWESTTPVYIKFITDERYRRLRPGYQKWYKPYRCSNCAAGITVKGE